MGEGYRGQNLPRLSLFLVISMQSEFYYILGPAIVYNSGGFEVNDVTSIPFLGVNCHHYLKNIRLILMGT